MKARTLPSSTATRQQLAETSRDRASWMKRGKMIFDSLPHPLVSSIARDNDHSTETQELGEFINQAAEQHRAEQTAQKRQLNQVRRAAGALGVLLPDRPRNLAIRQEALRRATQIRARIEAKKDLTP